MTPRILILGIGNAQVDLFEHCRTLGYQIFACSRSEAGPARHLADEFEAIDITDHEGVERYAASRSVDLVYSVGSDVAMPTACLVSERLGLPRLVGSRTALVCNDKPSLRASLGPRFRGNLDYEVIGRWDELQSRRFPLIMKPADSQGQRGVCLVHDLDEVRDRFEATRTHSRSGRVILESFVDGPEVSVNTYSVDGEVRFAVVSDRISWPQFPGGIIHEHRVPSLAASEAARASIADLVHRTLDSLAIHNGPAYFQLKLQGDEPYLIEVTPRLDGCHMWRLLKHYTSVDLLGITLEHLRGSPPDRTAFPPESMARAFRLEFLCDEPGRSLDRQRHRIPPALFQRWYYEDGATVPFMNGHYEKCGYFIEQLS